MIGNVGGYWTNDGTTRHRRENAMHPSGLEFPNLALVGGQSPAASSRAARS
jgi:hypothetical protein